MRLISRQDCSRIAEIDKGLIEVKPFSVDRARAGFSSLFLGRFELYECPKERPEMPIAVWQQALQPVAVVIYGPQSEVIVLDEFVLVANVTPQGNKVGRPQVKQ